MVFTDNSQKVHHPGDPPRFYTRFDSSNTREGESNLLPSSTEDKALTPLESMSSMLTQMHPTRRSCLAFKKGSPNILVEQETPRQASDKHWMKDEVLREMPKDVSAFIKLAQQHKLRVSG
jgi:hypothetical protein